MEIKIIYTSGIKEIYREKSSESRNYQYDDRDDMTIQRNTRMMKENTKQIKEWWETKEDMIQRNMTCGKKIEIAVQQNWNQTLF